MNLRRTRAIARKEMLHILRDSRSLFAALLQPLVMLLIFGWALSLDVDRIPTFVYDLDQSPQSRDLVRDFRGSRYFRVVDEVHGYRPIEQAINRRACLLGVVIPEHFAKNIGLKQPAQVQLLIDGSDSNTAAIAQGYAESIVSLYSRTAADAHSDRVRAGSGRCYSGRSRLVQPRPAFGKLSSFRG